MLQPVEGLSGPLERLRAMNRGTVVLHPREITVGLRLLPLSESMDAGVIPAAVTERVMEAKKLGKELSESELESIAKDTMDEAAAQARLRDFVARTITHLEGEPVEMTPEDTKEFTDNEFAQLLRYAMRQDPLPKASE
jgi:hypothetical protein